MPDAHRARVRVAVLISGAGSNMAALIDAARAMAVKAREENAALEARLAALDPSGLPELPSGTRLGPCVGNIGNVIGIGLNVRPQPGEGMSLPPGSLQEVEDGLDAPAALLRVAAPLVGMLQSFAAYGFAPMQPRFALRDVLQGRTVQLSDGTSGMAHGVGEDGALLVHTAGGMLPITSSEISVRPVPSSGSSA